MESINFIRPGNFSLFNIKKTQIEMMTDRGYEIPPSEKLILQMDQSQFLSYLNKLVTGEIDNEWVPFLDMINFPNNAKYTERTLLGNVYYKNNRKCLVIFIDQIGGQQIIKVITDAIIVMVEGIETGVKYDELILITKIPFSVVSKRCISDLRYTKHWMFFDKELILNVTKHALVPKHTIISKEDALLFKKTYNHTEQISEEDPIIKYYGWKVGDVVLIERDLSDMDMMVDKMIAKRTIVRSTAVNDGKK